MRQLFLGWRFLVCSTILWLSTASYGADRVVRVTDLVLAPGETNYVELQLAAQGDENRLALSLYFDPAELAYIKATAVGLSVEENLGTLANYTDSLSEGRVGFEFALPQGETFPAGSQAAFRVYFRANPSSGASNTLVTVGDTPISPQLTDYAGRTIMGVSYLPGTVTVLGICTFDLSPSNRKHGNGAATNSVAVRLLTGNGCPWTVVKTNEWISILSELSGSGTGMVSYAVATNPVNLYRTGVVMIAELPFTVIQEGIDCVFFLSPTNRIHGCGPATNTVDVRANPDNGCFWSLSNTNDWITILATNGMGTGTATVTYAISPNPISITRTGFVVLADQPFKVVQSGIDCTYSVSPPSRNHGDGGATNSFNVRANPDSGCYWTLSNTNDWITILSTNGMGTATSTVFYAVAPNPISLQRTGYVYVADQVFTIYQDGITCTYSLSPTNRIHGPGPTTNSFSLRANPDSGCLWSLGGSSDWITVLSVTGMGTGTSTVTYAVASNALFMARTGFVWVAEQPFTIFQNGNVCTYNLSPDKRRHGCGAASNSFLVRPNSVEACPWTITNNNSWISILGITGMGTATGIVSYAVATNPVSITRTGVIWVASEQYTIVQDGIDCSYSLSPTNRNHGCGATNNSFLVRANPDAGCLWNAVTTNDWIMIQSVAGAGTGTGIVAYAIAPNPISLPRTGFIMVETQAFTIVQAGINCSYSLSPTNRNHGCGATTNTFSVRCNPDLGCFWTVDNTNEWISILGVEGVATGTGTVSYAVQANPISLTRTGVVMVGEQPYTIAQSGITCTWSLSPITRNHGYRGGTNGFAVKTKPDDGCIWTVQNDNDWITIVSELSGNGTGAVSYAVQDNLNYESRTGIVMVADQVFKVTQDGLTFLKISPTGRTPNAAGSTGQVSVVAAVGRGWSVVNTNPWVTITSATNGAGMGTVSYIVAANSNDVRRLGVIEIAQQPFTLDQYAAVDTRLQAAQVLNGGFQFVVSGEPARHYRLEVSSNLVDWVTNTILYNPDGLIEFRDDTGGAGRGRFYRAVKVP